MKAKVQRWLVDWTDSLRRSLFGQPGENQGCWIEKRKKALKATEKERSLSQVKETLLQWTVMRCTHMYSNVRIESS